MTDSFRDYENYRLNMKKIGFYAAAAEAESGKFLIDDCRLSADYSHWMLQNNKINSRTAYFSFKYGINCLIQRIAPIVLFNQSAVDGHYFKRKVSNFARADIYFDV